MKREPLEAQDERPRRTGLAAAPESGQVLIFMVMALLILAVAAAWLLEAHTVLRLKARTQNAGDAAALAAARWQGITLNLIGDLNILQALALGSGNTNAAAQITNVQARLCFVGPLVGLLAAQQAAKNNRAYAHSEFRSALLEHADTVLAYYHADTRRFPEAYAGAWPDYAAMLSAIAVEGLAAGPDNTWYYTDSTDSHWLLSRGFYEAVAGRDWCWFFWHGQGLLRAYAGHNSWPALPTADPSPNTHNSEIFGLRLRPQTDELPGGPAAAARMDRLRPERRLGPAPVSGTVTGAVGTWYCYEWGAWAALAPETDFPIRPLRVKPEYDYAGADCVVRITTAIDRRVSDGQPGIRPFLARSSPAAARIDTRPANDATWTAAGKAFGHLQATDGAGGARVRPDAYHLVLPAFHAVRLIPVDAASGSNQGAYDLDWRRHARDHLPAYLQYGGAGLEADCWYCRQLETWDDPAFRQTGIDWLNDTNNVCDRGTSGPGYGGGTRRGH